MNDTPQPTAPAQPSRLIVVDSDGRLQIVGAWKVRELLAAAQMIANAANESELTFQPQAQ